MKPSFLKKIYQAHQIPKALPGISEIDRFVTHLTQFLYPELNNKRFVTQREIETQVGFLKLEFGKLLIKTQACGNNNVEDCVDNFFERLEEVYDLSQGDTQAILMGDPAAYDQKEVIRAYPGFLAISVYRIAHLMVQLGIPYLPRIFTENAHQKTGIDIHPGAKIGTHFCIDHGTGVVIGETTEIGNNVKLYQGVTLGALSVSKEMAQTKRHPTIEDNVVIYAGATILGGNTVIGENCIIGGSVWITKSIPANSQVYYTSSGQFVKELDTLES